MATKPAGQVAPRTAGQQIRSVRPNRAPATAPPKNKAPVAPQVPQGKKPAAAWGPSPKNQPSTGQIQHLTAMGFDEESARAALRSNAWNVNQALDWLLAHGSSTPASAPSSFLESGACEEEGSLGRQSTKDDASTCISRKSTQDDISALSSHRSSQEDATALFSRRSTQDDCSASLSSHGQSNDGSVTSEANAEDLDVAPAGLVHPSDNSAALQETPASVCQSTEAVAEFQRPDISASEPAKPASRAIATIVSNPFVATLAVPDRDGKELKRVRQTWLAEDNPAMLSVDEGSFVWAWTTSTTEQGWIYAEVEHDISRAGWVPEAVLLSAPENAVWKRAVCSWADTEGRVKIVRGRMLLVYPTSRTEVGWVYVITSEYRGCDVDARDEAQGALAGWAPEYCVQWRQ